jgi:hypothetical protein
MQAGGRQRLAPGRRVLWQGDAWVTGARWPPVSYDETAAADSQSEHIQACLTIVMVRGCAVRRFLSCSTLLLSGIQGLVEREGSRRQAAGELLAVLRASCCATSFLGSLRCRRT